MKESELEDIQALWRGFLHDLRNSLAIPAGIVNDQRQGYQIGASDWALADETLASLMKELDSLKEVTKSTDLIVRPILLVDYFASRANTCFDLQRNSCQWSGFDQEYQISNPALLDKALRIFILLVDKELKSNNYVLRISALPLEKERRGQILICAGDCRDLLKVELSPLRSIWRGLKGASCVGLWFATCVLENEFKSVSFGRCEAGVMLSLEI
ncbi:MAG: hypothetical protein IT292_04145 [Deltaproteobacteria bacterium]|nr:hypothetical protein [Deltaproteobacteria bacterium]